MPNCFTIIDGDMKEVSNDFFQDMLNELYDSPTQQSSEEPPKPFNRRNPNGSYNSKPLDKNYFRNYYKKNLSTPFQCPDCGRKISSKSNLSKHRQTAVCMNARLEK